MYRSSPPPFPCAAPLQDNNVRKIVTRWALRSFPFTLNPFVFVLNLDNTLSHRFQERTGLLKYGELPVRNLTHPLTDDRSPEAIRIPPDVLPCWVGCLGWLARRQCFG